MKDLRLKITYIALSLFCWASCDFPSSYNGMVQTKLVISYSDENARTILPDFPIPASYRISITDGPEAVDTINTSDSSIEIELKTGSYDISVDALDLGSTVIAHGDIEDVYIYPEENHIHIKIAVTREMGVGDGLFNLTIQWPFIFGDCSVEAYWKGAGAETELMLSEEAFQATLSNVDQPAGNYRLRIFLKNSEDDIISTRLEMVQIYEGLTTNAVICFTTLDKDYTAVECGSQFSLALKADGTVWAWGANDKGQLGDGSALDKATPIQVDNLTDIVAIASGQDHSLALCVDGTVWAWGSNDKGQLGLGTISDFVTTPAQIPTISSVIGIAAGGEHSLAVTLDGTALAWGYNYFGQLGDGTETQRSSPVPVLDSSMTMPVVTVAAGPAHSMAIDEEGTAWAWGFNENGQLGNGTTTSISVPVKLDQLFGAISLDAGTYHSMALCADGSVWTWGYDLYGQLGDGNTSQHLITLPQEITSIFNSVIAIAAGSSYSLALCSDGTLLAWGDNEWSQLGDGSTNKRAVPEQVSIGTDILAIAGGGEHALALDTNGYVWAWGSGHHSQIGDGTSTNESIPVSLSFTTDIISIAARRTHSLVVDSDGKIWTWGKNTDGQLGDNSVEDKLSPVYIPTSAEPMANVSGGDLHSLAVSSNGTVWAWGNNVSGKLGDGSGFSWRIPVQVENLENCMAIAAGDDHSLGLAENHTVWAWGSNNQGALGLGATHPNSNVPLHVSSIANIEAIAAGWIHSLALHENGTVWAWGNNIWGQIGNGDSGSNLKQEIPVQALDISNAISISAGSQHSLAVCEDGAIRAWGDNAYGQLGDGSTIKRSTPISIDTINTAVSVAAGQYHSLAICSDGSVWGWGNNEYGQLGDGTTSNRLTPVRMSGITNATALAAGNDFSLILADGQIYAAGNYYRLGIGIDKATPRSIGFNVYQ